MGRRTRRVNAYAQTPRLPPDPESVGNLRTHCSRGGPAEVSQPSAGATPRIAYFAKPGPVQLQEKGTAPLVTRTPAAQRRQLSAQRVSAGEALLEKRAPSGGDIARFRNTPCDSPSRGTHISHFLRDLPLHHPQLATKMRERSLGSGLRVRVKNRRASLGWADEGVCPYVGGRTGEA